MASSRKSSDGTPWNSKFPLYRGVVISIQVFRMNYGAKAAYPRGWIYSVQALRALSLHVRCIPQEITLCSLAYFILSLSFLLSFSLSACLSRAILISCRVASRKGAERVRTSGRIEHARALKTATLRARKALRESSPRWRIDFLELRTTRHCRRSRHSPSSTCVLSCSNL